MIEVRNLVKAFKDGRRGRVEALRGVNADCRPGEVYGLLGPNGAGKTTLLRIMATSLVPTSGTVRVLGEDAGTQPDRVRRSVGFLSMSTGLYGRLTPREQLRYFGELYDLAPAAVVARLEAVAAAFGLGAFLDRPCDKLSTGMRQRVNLARAVLHDPPVVILDEPLTGLDLVARRAVVEFIRRCRSDGRTVVLSTHVMAEVDALCDRVGVLHEGRMLFEGSLAGLKAAYGAKTEEALAALMGGGEA